MDVSKRLSSSSFSSNRSYTASELQNHIGIVSQLLVENKINQQTAWTVRITDILKTFVKKDYNIPLNSVASSLDVGAKVYSCRVDDVYSKTIKFVNTLTAEEDNNKANDESINDEQVNNPIKKHKKNVKKLNKSAYIDAKIANGNGQIPSIFAGNIILKEDSQLATSEKLFNILHYRAIESASINFDEISDSAFKKTDGSLSLDNFADELEFESDFSNYKLSEAFVDFDIAQDGEQNDLIIDDNPELIVELDQTLQEICVDEPLEDIETDEFDANFKYQDGFLQVTDILPAETLIETEEFDDGFESSLINNYNARFWAGPSFWKHKFNKKPTPVMFTGKPEQTKTKKQKSQITIDINLEETFDENIQVKNQNKARKSDKITLPKRSNKFYDLMKRSMIKPNVFLKVQQAPTKVNTNIQDIEEYNYDNLNDSNYVSENFNGFHENNDDDVLSTEQGETMQPDVTHLNMVNKPDIVEISHIPFALRAKKVNIKEVKDKTWNVVKNTNSLHFKSLSESVKSKFSTELSKEVTVHLVLIALLQLCNERSMILIDEGNMSYRIEK